MARGVARSIQRQSEEVFFVDHGSPLYLALQMSSTRSGKWISAKWGVSENNRKAAVLFADCEGALSNLVEKVERVATALTRAMGLILGDGGEPSGEEV